MKKGGSCNLTDGGLVCLMVPPVVSNELCLAQLDVKLQNNIRASYLGSYMNTAVVKCRLTPDITCHEANKN